MTQPHASAAPQILRAPQRFVCIHGHFYQPPRENAWLEAIEEQESAAPYHDWNERINHECYAANGSSRILNERNQIVRIVNNYSRISFNFGPTLLAWMERAAPLTYRRVLEADRVSAKRFGGHGSAIAQVYNHVIMPLAKTEDRITQIRWGIADFEHRFKRKPEGMWLAETAVDLETLDLLAQNGIRFTILAPHQCARVRAIATEEDPEAPLWHPTANGNFDISQAYIVRTAEGRKIAVFFYDSAISRAVAFEGLLNNGEDLAKRLLGSFRDTGHAGQLAHIATDGESYGHHHGHGDMALAYALHLIENNGEARLTNYGEFLELFPPAFEAEIAENTSWSCHHGVERWRANCYCGNVNEGWNQNWRGPLRDSLDWLRDAVRAMTTIRSQRLFNDPAPARDGYIQVLLERNTNSQENFFKRFVKRPIAADEQIAALKLMEIERHLQLMYTSCGWFFDDLAGIETVQVITYAGRVLQLVAELFGGSGAALEQEFLERLAEARSNRPEQETGAEIYSKNIGRQRVTLSDVGARYAIVSLFEPQPEISKRYCYEIQRGTGETITSGRGRFAYGQALVRSLVTLESKNLDYAVLHLGDQNLSAAVRATAASNGTSFQDFAHEIREAVTQANLPEAMALFLRDFGAGGYSLNSLFPDDQRRILKLLLDSTIAEMGRTLHTIYEDHISLLRYLSVAGMPKPEVLMLAAQFSLNAELRTILCSDIIDDKKLATVLQQLRADKVGIDRATLAQLASQRMLQAVQQLAEQPEEKSLDAALQTFSALRELPFAFDLWEAQNRWYGISQSRSQANKRDAQWDAKFRELGLELGIAVDELTADN